MPPLGSRIAILSLIGVFSLLATQASAQPPQPAKLERHPWVSVTLGLSVPTVRDPGDELRMQVKLLPAGMLSWMLGAGWGPLVLAARIECGFGGLRSRDEGVARGVGYVLGMGPSLRASLYEGALGVALAGGASFWHVGTAVEAVLGKEGDTYPQLAMQALAPGAALQVTGRRKNLMFELRYQRHYWFRTTDEAYASSFRAWDFMPSDQWLVSVGGWFDGRK